uniref:Uncharacterized protein n=1 Tax=Pseudothermotoga hypogea TaxID=57487 RepID=A0A832I6H0_9THEM
MYSTRTGNSYHLWADLAIEWNNISGDPLKTKGRERNGIKDQRNQPDTRCFVSGVDPEGSSKQVQREGAASSDEKAIHGGSLIVLAFWTILLIWLVRLLIKLV